MRRPRPANRLLTCALAATAALITGAGTAAAEPARPTADPSAPSPTAPLTEPPPQGTAPDGSIVGGEDLETRDVVVAEDAPALPDEIAASGWLVADAGTGDVLAARDPHGRYYPASTLKTLTLLTLAPELDPAQVVVGTEEDEQIEGSRVGLVEGGKYPVELLLKALILQSGNDAANALARAYGGVEETVAAMNEVAEGLGAYDTVAGGPSGLDVAGQTSSPYDLALIFRALIENPTTAEILLTRTAQMPPVPNLSAGYPIQNENPLLDRYPGNLGGKTGFTDAARHTFVTAAEKDDRRLVVSVMDTEASPLRAADQAELLLDWGFSVPASAEPVGRLVRPADLVEATPDSTTGAGTPEAAALAGRTSAAPPEETSTDPLLATAFAITAALIVVATMIGRRRARRPVRTMPAAQAPARAAPRPPAGSPSRPR